MSVTKEMIEAVQTAIARKDITFAHCDSKWQKDVARVAIEAALPFLSSRSAEAGKPVVKGLEWASSALDTQYGLIIRIAKTPFGVYKILKGTQNRYEVYFGDAPYSGSMDDEDQAKAWAQSDYERRILSALAAPVADRGPVSMPDVDAEKLVTRFEKAHFSRCLVETGKNIRAYEEARAALIAALSAAPQPNPNAVDAVRAQNEWLKDRLAFLQLPARRAHERDQWLIECGMPTALAAQGEKQP